jgi:hypothetical protein
VSSCTVPGCTKPSRNNKPSWCRMHYHRWYRHGDVHTVSTGVHTSVGRRYRTTHRPDHPLAGSSGRIYVHRLVLWDTIGPGSHLCHWCGLTEHWSPTDGRPALQVDHLDGVGDNNDAANLVPACGRCNGARAAAHRSAALRASGWFAQNDTVSRLTANRT